MDDKAAGQSVREGVTLLDFGCDGKTLQSTWMRKITYGT